MQFEGIYTPLITPYHDGFSLNEEALAQTVEHLIGADVMALSSRDRQANTKRSQTEERLEMMTRCKGLAQTEDSVMFAAVAVVKAGEAFDQGHRAKLHPSKRKDILNKFCKLITRNKRELAVMESLDSGKPILDCGTVDISEMIQCIELHAEVADKIYEKTGPFRGDAKSMIVHRDVKAARWSVSSLAPVIGKWTIHWTLQPTLVH